jgi:hypothetical protein
VAPTVRYLFIKEALNSGKKHVFYLQSGNVSRNWTIVVLDGSNFQNDGDGEGRPPEDELRVSDHSSRCVDRLSVCQVLGQPRAVIVDSNSESITSDKRNFLNQMRYQTRVFSLTKQNPNTVFFFFAYLNLS